MNDSTDKDEHVYTGFTTARLRTRSLNGSLALISIRSIQVTCQTVQLTVLHTPQDKPPCQTLNPKL